MKILPINVSTNQYSKNGLHFKGLWGRTINNDHVESECYISETIYQYYPFSDETKEQIEDIKNANKRYKESMPGNGLVQNPWPNVDSIVISVMAALPFSSKEFLNFTMNRLSDAKRAMIEKCILKNGLSIIKK